MADTNANLTASRSEGTKGTTQAFVSSQTDNCECPLDNAAPKQCLLPNGCLKHSLEENGRVRLLGNEDETCIRVCENGCGSGDDERELCNIKCTNVGTVCDNTDNSKLTDQNGQESANCDQSVARCSEGIEKITCDVEKLELQDNDSQTVVESSATTDVCCRPDVVGDLQYVVYESELQMPDIMRLITKDLSEPYSIYTYRYFIHNWPRLCFLAMDKGKYVGAIVCKHDLHKKMVRRGYIAMLAVDYNYRRGGVGSHLVMKAIRAMVAEECDEVVLETEITNKAALRLYENLGFLRDKRLFRYYLNGVDALRLKLWLR